MPHHIKIAHFRQFQQPVRIMIIHFRHIDFGKIIIIDIQIFFHIMDRTDDKIQHITVIPDKKRRRFRIHLRLSKLRTDAHLQLSGILFLHLNKSAIQTRNIHMMLFTAGHFKIHLLIVRQPCINIHMVCDRNFRQSSPDRRLTDRIQFF